MSGTDPARRCGIGLLGLALFACSRAHAPPPPTTLDDQPPALVSAFFGLDDALPLNAIGLCRQAPGRDGLPVTFSRRVVGPIDPASFTVHTRSGQSLHPLCATTAPANAPAKNHTVLLIGALGSEPDDPPTSVELTGPLALEGGQDAKGLTHAVVPLADGPTLVLALGLRPGDVPSTCPANTRQLVVAIWAGGVHAVSGKAPQTHRQSYRLSTPQGEVLPFALGDLDDQDNYVHLCLDTEAPATRVSMAAGVVVDPRGDANPATSCEVSPSRH